jgi:hypothetical protein
MTMETHRIFGRPTLNAAQDRDGDRASPSATGAMQLRVMNLAGKLENFRENWLLPLNDNSVRFLEK